MTEKYLTKNYLQVLEESLYKKVKVLQKIEELNSRQEQILKAEVVVEKDFDASIEEKGLLIDELNKLDEGFENLYAHIKEQLLTERYSYKQQISVLQELIVQVTEKGVSIQTQEARNKVLVEKYFATEKQKLQRGRRSSKVAFDYYRNMKQSQIVEPQFMDKKK